MNDSENERLAAALARLEQRQDEMAARLARLEGSRAPAQQLRAEPAAPAPPPERAVPPEPATPPESALTRDVAPQVETAYRFPRLPEAPAPPAHEPSGGFEARMGLTLVNRVGVVTLVLGAAFFFKYAVDSGWIGPWARVLTGLAAGLGALAMGERTRRGGQQVYAQGIASAGVGILYLTVWAAFALYHVVPQGAAFVLMAVVTGTAAALALRYGSVALAALGLAGGYATPLLLSAGDQPWFVLGYVLLLNVGVVYLVRERGWRSIEPLAALGTVWVWCAQAPRPMPPDRRAVYTGFALAYWALAGAFAVTPIAAAAQVLLPLAVAGLWSTAPGAYFGLSLAIAAAGLVAAERRGWPLVPLAASWFSFWFWSGEMKRPPLPSFWFLTALFVLFVAWLPWRVWVRRAAAQTQDLVFAALNAGLYFAPAYVLLGPDYAAWRGLVAVLVASIHMLLAWSFWDRDKRAALLAAGVGWALLLLAAPAQFSGYRVTVVWALEGAALAWIGARTREERATGAAVLFFALVVIRLLFIDTVAYGSPYEYAMLANARFLTFAMAAACLWAAAKWTASGAPAAGFYIAGHFTALWGLSLEVLGWAGRTAAPANLHSIETTAVSILMACYALALVGAGVFTATVVNRALGLGLIGIVVLKLYFYDVWFLPLFYRMAAFAALGALLLAMSYIYSRHRVTLERLWRGGNAG